MVMHKTLPVDCDVTYKGDWPLAYYPSNVWPHIIPIPSLVVALSCSIVPVLNPGLIVESAGLFGPSVYRKLVYARLECWRSCIPTNF